PAVGLAHRNRQVEIEVEPRALEHRMGPHAHREQQIAGWASRAPGGALTGNAQPVAVARAGWDAHGDLVAAILQAHLELGALDRREEVDDDLALQVGAARRAAPPAASEKVAENVADAADVAEQILEAHLGAAPHA